MDTAIVTVFLLGISAYLFVGIAIGEAWFKENDIFYESPRLRAVIYGATWIWPPIEFLGWIYFKLIWGIITEIWHSLFLKLKQKEA